MLILYLIGNIGCSSEEEDYLSLAKQENIEALSASTRSVVITVCSDAFVDVGGYSEYKGTTCKTYSVGGGGIPSGRYSPGGFPQHGKFEDQGTGGRGNSYYIGDLWKFKFPKMQEIYDAESTLNVKQKSHLEHVFKLFDEFPSDYKKMLNKLLAQNIRIKFSIDPTISNSAEYNGLYNTIRFKSESHISWTYLIEEIVHAVQKICYYKSTMNNKYKNYEFEAQVFIDLVNGISGASGGIGMLVEYRPRQNNTNPVFYDEYTKWIDGIIKKGTMTGSDYNTFNSLCDMWAPPSGGSAIPNFVPKLIEEFFRKPHPPIRP